MITKRLWLIAVLVMVAVMALGVAGGACTDGSIYPCQN